MNLHVEEHKLKEKSLSYNEVGSMYTAIVSAKEIYVDVHSLMNN
jgi:hypothetical protein